VELVPPVLPGELVAPVVVGAVLVTLALPVLVEEL
jgi:hypothetical protein